MQSGVFSSTTPGHKVELSGLTVHRHISHLASLTEAAYTLRTDARDRFAPPLEHCFCRAQIRVI